MKSKTPAVYVPETIHDRIFTIRGQKVILDTDLASLYGVETKVLNQTIKRNAERFPLDFMFQLAPHEDKNLTSQIVTSSSVGMRPPKPIGFGVKEKGPRYGTRRKRVNPLHPEPCTLNPEPLPPLFLHA